MSTSTPYSCRISAAQHRLGRSGCQHPSAIEQNQARGTVRPRDSDRGSRPRSVRPRLAVELAEDRSDLELIREIERRGRLVEQQHLGRRREGFAVPETLENWASAPAMTTRCFSPPDSVLNNRDSQVERAGRAQRLARDGSISSGLRFRMRRGADSGPSPPSRARCSRRRAVFPAGRRPSASTGRGAAACAGRRRRGHAAAPAAEAGRQQAQQRRLARSVRAENADEAPRGTTR